MRGNRLARLLLVLVALSLVAGIGRAGMWAPHEVSVAELSRRVAHNLLGGDALAVAGADNSVPIRAEIGRGELPFTSAAVGYRVFGLSEWAGRLPLALWAVLGLLSLYMGLAKLWDERAALYGVVVLATTPLYFLQARTLLGDAVTLSAFCMAWSGLSVATLVPALPGHTRWGYALLGVVGLYAGFWCRGALPSVAVPALSAGLTVFVSRPAIGRLGLWLALGISGVGLAALLAGLSHLAWVQAGGDYSVFVGGALGAASEPATFDTMLGQLGHSAFPWSALAPMALLGLGRRADEPAGTEHSAPLVAAVLGLSLSLASGAWLAPALGATALPGLCCFAALVGFGLRETEERGLGAPLLGLSAAALALIIGFDLQASPDKALAGFALSAASMPESFHEATGRFWVFGALGFGATCALLLYEQDAHGQTVFRRAEYERVLRQLQRVWDGNLVFALLVLESALVGFLALAAISERLVPLPPLETFGASARRLAALAAVAVPLGILLPLTAMLLRDLARLLFRGRLASGARWPRPTRVQGILLVGAAFGLAASHGFYPALARQISPKLVFERYRELRRAGEPLGVLGEAGEAARYHGSARLEPFDAAPSAFEWLGRGGPRRWLLLRGEDLAELNSLNRQRSGRNLAVLDARSSGVLLASSELRPTEQNENPLARYFLSAEPTPQHPLDVGLGHALDVLGFSVLSLSGVPETSLVPGTHYRFVSYFRVKAPVSGTWQAFVHFDGAQRRFNADHPLLDDRYPMSLWHEGDIIADSRDFSLEPNFTAGSYRIYFGLFSGGRRFEVSRGEHEENRIVGGELRVR